LSRRASELIGTSVLDTADSTASYLPVYFTNLEISVLDHTTNKEIATGNWRNHKLARGDAEFVSLPVEFAYQGVNASDTTCTSQPCPFSGTGESSVIQD
jgi:hypothetical protein